MSMREILENKIICSTVKAGTTVNGKDKIIARLLKKG